VQVAHMRMSFGLSWYSASRFDIFSRAFAGAVVARTKLTMPARCHRPVCAALR
jgi:hypothetical protein